MDLRTNYLGMTLSSPLVASASPISEHIDNIKHLEDAGAGAVVLYSIFEEQFKLQQHELHFFTEQGTDSYAEALSFFPQPEEFKLGPDEYLNHIRKAKDAVKIPVIASINGTSLGGWTEYAKYMEEAGADAVELNIYNIPTNFDKTGAEVEANYLEIIKAVKAEVKIPVAVKLSPYFSNMSNMAKKLDEVGANGLVLFNRFYQPDIDLEHLEVNPTVTLSSKADQRLPLRWIGILKGRIKADLAATSGIHDADDVLKMLLVGANITQLCSVLLKNGIEYLRVIEKNLISMLEQREYESVHQLQGSMSQLKNANPGTFERAQYMKALTSYKF